jgi:UDP-N-acetyl-D-mannosaminuronic acid dehydrogenase
VDTKLISSDFDVTVIGLGYVGLTLASALANNGLRVVGIEKLQDVVDSVNAGEPHFYEKGLREQLCNNIENGNFVALGSLPKDFCCHVYILTVGTPLDKEGAVNLQFIKNAAREISEHLQDGDLVILRSTVKIGVTDDIVRPILEDSGVKFGLAMCPERTLEGSALKELPNLPQIIGANDQYSQMKAAQFFNKLTDTVINVSSTKTAEIIKLVDNTYRDVRFAFGNEIARACDIIDVDANEVIKYGSLGYERTNVAMPGLVGGPCLEKDPHIFSQSINEKGFALEITEAARLVNERQPLEILSLLNKHKTQKKPIITATIWGLAFKGSPITNDLRGSMSITVLNELRRIHEGLEIRVFDPAMSGDESEISELNLIFIDSIWDSILNSDILLICNNNSYFQTVDFKKIIQKLSSDATIIDFWNSLYQANNSIPYKNYFSIGTAGELYKNG